MMLGKFVKRPWFAMLLLALSGPASAQKTTVIPLATSSTWRFEGSQKISVDDLRPWGADPAIEAEYGVKQVERRDYTLYPDGKKVEVLVEKASDPSAAYGLLTIYTGSSMTSLQGHPLTRVGPGSAFMVRESNFIRIEQPVADKGSGAKGAPATAPSQQPFPFSLGELRQLLVLVGGQGPSADELRARPTPLPLPGLVQGSEKYLLGQAAAQRVLPSFPVKLIGFSMGAEVRMATYASHGNKVRVMAITYPTPQIAQMEYSKIQKSLLSQEQGQGAAYGKQTGSFVILVLDARSPKEAAALLKGLKSSERVSWDKPYPGDESIVIQMVKLVLANIFLTFILAGFALGGGVIFFMSKRLAMRWFPQSSFGQPDEATIIRLNLD